MEAGSRTATEPATGAAAAGVGARGGADIEVTDLAKTYGSGEAAVHALRAVSFSVPAGQVVVLLGSSGSGKTTLLNVIGAIEEPTSGRVVVDGAGIADMDEDQRTEYRRRTAGFVFQFYNLVPTLTAVENVELIAELVGGDARARSAAVLTEVGLGDRLDHFPAQLSGGQQQRVALARALVKNPPLLLADEPTGALDVETGRQVLAALERTARQRAATVLMVTHNAVIARMADRVLRLRDGEIVADEVVASPVAPDDLEW